MKDPLPVPDQLEKQLSKCKTVRDADTYFKSRDKTKEVSVSTMGCNCNFIIVVTNCYYILHRDFGKVDLLSRDI